MFRLFRSIAFWILFIFFGGLTALFFIGNSFSGKEEAELPIQVAPQSIPSLDALLVQVDEETGSRRILRCSDSGCVPINPPASVGINPLSDGSSWYRYAEKKDKFGDTAVVLEKVDAMGNSHTITEENPLVRPREMMLSSDGTKIAYFLDNIHDEKDLTELWVYDSKEGGSKVIGEKLKQNDVASRVRWNASSRITWFLQEQKQKQLIAASISETSAKPRFIGVDWEKYGDIATHGVMDISDDMSLLAFGEESSPGFSNLLIARENEPAVPKPVQGKVVFLRWMEKNTLLYAVQDGSNLSFWMKNATQEWPIARMDGMFESAHSPGTSGLAAVVARPKGGPLHLYVLQIATGRVKDQTSIPHFSGATYVVQTREVEKPAVAAIAGETSVIPDTEIVAFLEEHARAITEDSHAKLSRLLMTDVPNTLFVDYTDHQGAEQRILATVVDVVNPEWNVLARYTTINGIWNRADSSGATEPKVLRLYEWEEQVSQWILKQEY